MAEAAAADSDLDANAPAEAVSETPAAAPGGEALAPVIIIKRSKMAMAVPTVALGRLRWPT